MAGQDKKGQRTSNESSPDANASSGEPAFRFHYDALDTLTGRSTSSGKEHRFYRNDELANEIQGGVSRTFLRAEGTVLAEQQVGGEQTPLLLAGDEKNSVLAEVSQDAVKAIAYSAYGHRTADAAVSSLFGYNGERRETQTGWYLLGNGYRVFNPLLMRFHSPDSLSPFGEGGLNAYMYCVGDPINSVDPTGHVFLLGGLWRGLRSFIGGGPKFTTDSSFSETVPKSFLRNPHKNRPATVHTVTSKHLTLAQKKATYLGWKAKSYEAHVDTITNSPGPAKPELLAAAMDVHDAYVGAAAQAYVDYKSAVEIVGTKGITSQSIKDLEKYEVLHALKLAELKMKKKIRFKDWEVIQEAEKLRKGREQGEQRSYLGFDNMTFYQ
ncbi:RHS repeat-associated core domain-containing protein [Pseudomonas sp. G166]|uniref:RHS repeat-associated core domain-containing protein n=1 Tax=Pseudomonas sp. G166 TaxID=3094846 RepID=UPI00300B0DEF